MTATVEADAPEQATRVAAEPRRARLAHRVVLAVLLVQFVAVGLWQARHDSLTVDEAVDVASGVTSLVRHDLRMNPEHGPLPKVLAALPTLLADPIVPDGDAYDTASWFDHTDEFVVTNRDAGKLDQIRFLARLVPLAIGASCALLIHRLGRQLFSPLAGLVAAGLWLTTPVFVGLSHFAMIDVPFTFTVLLLCECLRRHLVAPSTRTLLALGAASAAALLTRHLALALLGALVLWLVAAGWRADRRAALVAGATVALVAFAGVWVGIRAVAPEPLDGEARARHEHIVDTASADSLPAKAVAALPLPLEWESGFAYLTLTADQRPAFLFGQAWEGNRVWFFPGSLLTKLPLGALALVGAAPFAWRRLDAERRRLATIVVLAPAALTFALVLVQPLNLGVRLAFPTVALLLVAAGAAATHLAAGRRKLLLGAIALTQLVAFWEATPHSLAWTAPPFRPAYRWVSDSNLDFGQDADRLADWVAERTAAGDTVWTSQILPRGGSEPEGARSLLGVDPTTIRGWVAIGATSLTVVNHEQFGWLRAYCPVGTIGGSILIYRFDVPPVVTDGPTMPAGPCEGPPSRR